MSTDTMVVDSMYEISSVYEDPVIYYDILFLAACCCCVCCGYYSYRVPGIHRPTTIIFIKYNEVLILYGYIHDR